WCSADRGGVAGGRSACWSVGATVGVAGVVGAAGIGEVDSSRPPTDIWRVGDSDGAAGFGSALPGD
ncbi:MAG: hypothetical protein ABI307_14825, partial [Mycobacterium sp.]